MHRRLERPALAGTLRHFDQFQGNLMFRTVLLALSTLLAASLVHAQALDGRLKKIADSKTIAIAYRADAIPFSFTDETKQVIGFSIDLCKRVVNSIERQINVPNLQIKWVPVTTQTRFEAIMKGQADMECGSSTMTLSRMKQVDFSNPIFLETTGLVVKSAAGIRSFSDMSGKSIVVIAGTTNERAVNDQMKRRQVNATVVAMKSREEAFAAFDEGKFDAFASDKLLLLGAAMKAKNPKALALLDDDLSVEPYGIVLPRGDASLRLAVNTGLSQIYTSGEIGELFKRWLAIIGRPGAMLEAVYILGSIPE
ncbi:MAG: amino acid ABC transporter substrate-binding protein [Rhodoferax sp.]